MTGSTGTDDHDSTDIDDDRIEPTSAGIRRGRHRHAVPPGSSASLTLIAIGWLVAFGLGFSPGRS